MNPSPSLPSHSTACSRCCKDGLLLHRTVNSARGSVDSLRAWGLAPAHRERSGCAAPAHSHPHPQPALHQSEQCVQESVLGSQTLAPRSGPAVPQAGPQGVPGPMKAPSVLQATHESLKGGINYRLSKLDFSLPSRCIFFLFLINF